MAKKQPRPTRTASAPAEGESDAGAPPLESSAAMGVRLLRERVEAHTSGTKRARQKLAHALSRLEGEYERLRRANKRAAARQVFGSPAERARRLAAGLAPIEEAGRSSRPAVGFVPTPPELVDTMLAFAGVTPEDVVYDLGSGDGRIVIAAARQHGARGVGFDHDPERISEANAAAEAAGVTDLVSFRQADLYAADVREATVVMLYLLPVVNLELRDRLRQQLRPGTRIVSHAFDMGDWPPSKQMEVSGSKLYLWVVPAASDADDRDSV